MCTHTHTHTHTVTQTFTHYLIHMHTHYILARDILKVCFQCRSEQRQIVVGWFIISKPPVGLGIHQYSRILNQMSRLTHISPSPQLCCVCLHRTGFDGLWSQPHRGKAYSLISVLRPHTRMHAHTHTHWELISVTSLKTLSALSLS